MLVYNDFTIFAILLKEMALFMEARAIFNNPLKDHSIYEIYIRNTCIDLS